MLLLLIKLLLTPLLIGLVSLIERRWGPAVSGWFVGLPLTSAPVALFLALEQGTSFAAHAAQGTMLGLLSVAGFCFTYSWLSLRLNWLWCILIGWSVFFVLTFILQQSSLPLLVAFLSVIIFLIAELNMLPRERIESTTVKPPHWETPIRMLVAALFVVAITGTASWLGPQLSGLLTPFPIFASILGVFTHRFQGAAVARRVLRGVITGSFTFAVFFLILASLIALWGIVAAFSLAVLSAVIVHSSSLLWMTRNTRLAREGRSG